MGDPERDAWAAERQSLLAERDALQARVDALTDERDALLDDDERRGAEEIRTPGGLQKVETLGGTQVRVAIEPAEPAAPIHRRRAPLMPGAPGRWASGTSAIQAAAERMIRATEPPDDARLAGSGDIIAAL